MATLSASEVERTFLFSICSVLLLTPSAVRGETATLPASADTCLFELNPDYNFGGQSDLPSGTLGALASFSRSRVLLRFDLAGNLPSNALIHFAYLQLRVTRIPDGGGEDSAFGLHRMLRPWGEGVKRGSPPGGAQAEAGEATWNVASHPDEFWGQPGGQAGVDYEADFSSSERIQQDGEYQFEFGPAQIGELTEWLRNPNSNFGWMLISTAEGVSFTARRFGSRENTSLDLQPQLVIDYTVSSPTITGISLNPDGTTAITFQAEPGLRYRLEATSALPAQAWETAAPLTAAGSTGDMTLVDSSPHGVLRFFRVASE